MTLNGVAARTSDGRTLFENLSLAFGRERTGVVGRNGSGKTTLLRLIAGLAQPAEGAVSRPGRVGLLVQTTEPGPDDTVATSMGAADGLKIVTRILTGEGDANDLVLADWTLEDRLAEALGSVGLQGLAPDRLTRSLSGGEQTRLRLAALLLNPPDLLVLDEPTNHLDADGRAAVADLLARWTSGAVVVSHDRELLRRMDRIVELSALGASIYGGGYDLYAERKRAETAAAERDLASAETDAARVARETQRASERKARRDRAGRAFRARGSEPRMFLDMEAERAEHSAARESRLAARVKSEAEANLEAARERVERVRALSIPMPPTGLAAGRSVLTLDGASWSAPNGSQVLEEISLGLTGPERVAISGPNGAGKTTLLRLMNGDLMPTTGRVERPVAAALLDQEAAILRRDETLLDAWMRLNPGGTPNDAQAALARFLFRNAAAQRQVGALSGGERLRAALACVMTGVRPPQLLILDEPTNHLDLDSIEAVEGALSAYDGALVVVSHDADFLDAIGCDRRIALPSVDHRDRQKSARARG